MGSGFRSSLVVDESAKSIFPEFKIDIPMPTGTVAPNADANQRVKSTSSAKPTATMTPKR